MIIANQQKLATYVFVAEVRKQLHAAWKLYDLENSPYNKGVTASDVEITVDVKGTTAGWACCKTKNGKRVFSLRFSKEAVANHYDTMVNEVVPHEIAHTVCQMNARFGNNHNKGWVRVCKVLGGNGNRTHGMKLTPARKTTKHVYMIDGNRLELGTIRHNKIQRGATGYHVTFPQKGKYSIAACDYVGVKAA
jgi:predicted SprT family Zn-dependent metalloprotease